MENEQAQNKVKKSFNCGGFFFGLFIVAAGVLLLSQNMGWVNLSGFNWFSLWPLLIIIAGLSIMPCRGWFGIIVSIIMLLIFIFAFLVGFGVIKAGSLGYSTKVITQERQVASFNKISLSGVGNLVIKQGDKELLNIEASESTMQRIKTEVDNSNLKIGYDWDWSWQFFQPQSAVNFQAFVKQIDSISVSGAGNISSDKISSEKFNMSISGAGKANLNLEVKELTVEGSGASQFIMAGLADSQNIQVSGAGKYNAKDLQSKNVKVKISGVGEATVNAQETLDVEISGLGKVYYTGNPQITQKISGGGQVVKLPD